MKPKIGVYRLEPKRRKTWRASKNERDKNKHPGQIWWGGCPWGF